MRFSLLFACFALFFTAACQKEGSKTSNTSTFVYCSEGGPSAFNPQITTDGTSNNAAGLTLYNRLVDFRPGTTEAIPSLAKSWKISKDGKTYTFELHQNVQFHTTSYFKPTRALNADDVLFSFNRQFDKKHPYHKTAGGSYEYWNAMDMSKIIKSIEKLGSYTVRINLAKAEAPFLANLGMSFTSILSKEYGDQLLAKKRKEDIDNLPVGTGPYVFQKYIKDTLIRYTAHKDFFGEKPQVKKLVFAITPDANVRFQKLKAGECHLIIEPSPADLDAIANDPELKLLKGPGLNVGYMAMNTQKGALKNRDVRQAINLALDRKSYIDAIYRGHAEIAVNPLPPTIWSYDSEAKVTGQDLKQARALMKKAGYAKGLNLKLWALPVTRPYNPNGKKMAELMQADLKKIGINIDIVTYDWPTYLSKSRKGEHELIQIGWTGDNGDPDNFLYVLLGKTAIESGSNLARWNNPEFNRLISKAKNLSSRQERAKLYKKAQEIFRRELPWAPIAHSTVFRAMRKNVTGYIIDPLGGDKLGRVGLK